MKSGCAKSHENNKISSQWEGYMVQWFKMPHSTSECVGSTPSQLLTPASCYCASWEAAGDSSSLWHLWQGWWSAGLSSQILASAWYSSNYCCPLEIEPKHGRPLCLSLFLSYFIYFKDREWFVSRVRAIQFRFHSQLHQFPGRLISCTLWFCFLMFSMR